jgi:hypothetical protein
MGAVADMSSEPVSGLSAGSLTLTVLAVVLGSSLFAALLTSILTGLRGSAVARRDSYAAAVRSVVAWAEYPYRVRRRTDDDSVTLASLAALGSDLQEGLACHRAWVCSESPVVGEELGRVIETIRSRVGHAIVEAWRSSPVKTADGMNLYPFGPGDLAPAFDRLYSAIRWRFGLRRLTPNWFVRWRLNAAGPLVLPTRTAPFVQARPSDPASPAGVG